jgi:hypothetical protein
MADNLTISIGGDTSKLRADLARAQADVRAFGRELKQAAETARTTGDQSTVLPFARQLDVATRSAALLQRQMRQTYQTIGDKTPWVSAIQGATTLTRSMGGLSQVTSGLSELLGKGGKFGLAAAASALLIGEIVSKIKEVAEASHEASRGVQDLTDKAHALNIPTENLERLRLAGAKKGIEDVDTLLLKTQKLLGETQLEMVKTTGQRPGGPTVFRGGQPSLEAGGVTTLRGGGQYPTSGDVAVLRGGQKPVLEDIYQQLGLDPKKYFGPAGSEKFLVDAAKALDTWGNEAAKAAVAEEVFGKKWAEGIGFFKDLPSQIDQAGKDIVDRGGYITDKTKEQANNNIAEWAKMERAITSSSQTIGTSIGESISPMLDRMGAAATAAREHWVGFTGQLSEEWRKTATEVAAGIPTDQIQTNSADIQSAYVGAFRNIGAAWQALQAQIGAKVGAGPGAGEAALPPPIPPPSGEFAEGGFVRGAGTGTSDSIMARLSNGEFVMRASAVDHWGPRFLASLNNLRDPFGYALGGLVDSIHAPVPGFADGGLVGPGGTPVHLHLGGHSFALTGASGIVNALVAEAGRHQIRSGGTKPSWYGSGRING